MSEKLAPLNFFAGCQPVDLETKLHQHQGLVYNCSGESILNILGPGGLLEKRLGGFGAREQQTAMALKVAKVLMQGGILVQEAATGTGKSIAYLVPALLWAKGEQRRVMVSTRTITLQEQLWHKDVPLLLEALGIKIKVALAKGKNNYVCLWRLHNALRGPGSTPGEAAFFSRVLNWVKEGSITGDRSELKLGREEMDYWQQICADSDLCQNYSCRWHSRECYIGKARRAAEAAGLVITNHSLLFSDIKSGGKVLPQYDHLVVDEAHHLEDTATDQLGIRVSSTDMRRWLKMAARLILRLWSLIPPDNQQYWQQSLAGARELRDSLPATLELFFGGVHQWVLGLAQGSEEGARTVRLTREALLGGQGAWPIGQYHDFAVKLKDFCHTLDELLTNIFAWSENNPAWEETGREVAILLEQGRSFSNDLKFIFNMEDDNYVFWAEIYGWDSVNVRLQAAPVNIGETLYNNLFLKKYAMILTSATLSVNNDLKYFMNRVGLGLSEDLSVTAGCSGSPFSYDKQCRLCIADDIPAPAEDYKIYINKISGTVVKLVTALGGKTLVLFTSHKTLRQVYYTIKPSLESEGILLLGHKLDGGRTALIDRFRGANRSVLLGADSFWEGVDLPGDILQCVVIVKLPFWPPSVPVVQARLEKLEEMGVSPFYNYSLPQAVLKFKQGFGRLIRTIRDRGAILVLDGRILYKNYGRIFLNSLPVKAYSQGESFEMAEEVCRFIKSGP